MPANWLNKDKPVRKKSIEQERKFAKKISGKTTSNSGARFSENDVTNEDFSFELKITSAKSYVLKESEIKKMLLRAEGKIPVFVVEFENGLKIATLEFSDFESLFLKEKS